MKNTPLRRYKLIGIGIVLALVIALAPSPARASWSFSIYSPSGYIIIGSGGVAVGVAVVIGYIYIWGEARTSALLPPARVGLVDNPADFKDKGQAFSPSLDLVSYRF